MSKDIDRKTWDEFCDSGLLWWVNRIIHVFGWAIIMKTDCAGKVIEAYPARVTFRGFPETVEEEKYMTLTKYLGETMPAIAIEQAELNKA